MEAQTWHGLISGLSEGDRETEDYFWVHFGPSLTRLAERRIAPRLRRRFSAEDAVQSAYRTFLRRAHRGQFNIPDNASLWRLLCAITLTKIREKARFHLRERRDVTREEYFTPAALVLGELTEVAGPQASPADAVAFAEEFQRLLEALDGEERHITQLKLADYTNREIAERIACSQRTVERILRRVRGRLSRILEDV